MIFKRLAGIPNVALLVRPIVHEIIPSYSTIYRLNNILYIIHRETSGGRSTDLDVSMAHV